MKCITARLTGKGPWTVGATGDWHEGHPSAHDGGVRHFLERSKRLSCWLHHADAAECVLPNDRRFSIDEHGKVSVIGSWRMVVEHLSAGRRNCLGMVSGNHEGAVSKLIGNVSRFLCDYAGITYLTQTVLIRLSGPAHPVTWGAAHGHMAFTGRGIDSERERLNREKRMRRYITSVLDADIMGIGHGHRAVVAPPVYERRMTHGGRDALRRPVLTNPHWCYMCPSFLRVYGDVETYAEGGMFQPSDLGWIEFVIERSGEIPCLRVLNEDGKVIEERTPNVLG